MTVIQSDMPYSLDEWHTAVVARAGRTASLSVDSREVGAAEAPGTMDR